MFFSEEGRLGAIKVILFEMFAISAALYTGFLCYLSTRFSKATARTLRHYEAVLNNSDEFLKSPNEFLKRLDEEDSEAGQ